MTKYGYLTDRSTQSIKSSMSGKNQKKYLINNVRDVLAELLNIESQRLTQVKTVSEADLEFEFEGKFFIIEYRASSAIAPLKAAMDNLLRMPSSRTRAGIPLVCVPFMGEAGSRLCREMGISWFDLSGNAWIRSQDVFINVQGRPNLFKAKGRPADIFAPKSSRIARWLLINFPASFSQKDLARSTGMDEGFVSRIVSRMISQDLVQRDDSGKIRLQDPDALLDIWREKYRIHAHQFLKGHIAARNGPDLLRHIAQACQDQGMEYACTGLGAAWLYSGFAAFRIAGFYLMTSPSASWMENFGFQEEPKGANVWLIVPKDEGVFHGATEVEGLQCVHPLQAYLDLKDHPERSAEAAEQLRKDFLRWEGAA